MHYNEFYKTLISKLELPEEAEKEFTDVVKLADENLQFGRELDKLIMRFMFPKAHDIRRFMENMVIPNIKDEFDKKRARIDLLYGYNDTMKKFGKLYGKKYTFHGNLYFELRCL